MIQVCILKVYIVPLVHERSQSFMILVQANTWNKIFEDSDTHRSLGHDHVNGSQCFELSIVILMGPSGLTMQTVGLINAPRFHTVHNNDYTSTMLQCNLGGRCRMIDCIPHFHFMLLHMHLLYFRYVNIPPTIIIIMKKDLIVYFCCCCCC